ncbi:uncharacterized protein LOC134211653 [Armigeres subalbatus]|uniref:uncharacterized protein LOC134211653 n=1 Tax=Armigeres subalbatus TaxID=124917 RepID=UPI002ED56748
MFRNIFHKTFEYLLAVTMGDGNESAREAVQCEGGKESTEMKINQLKKELGELRSLLLQLLLETDRKSDEINQLKQENEYLREQRTMLLQGPLNDFPRRQKIKDILEGNLETIGETEPLRMYIINGRFRFDEMRKWKRNGEKDRKWTVYKYRI